MILGITLSTNVLAVLNATLAEAPAKLQRCSESELQQVLDNDPRKGMPDLVQAEKDRREALNNPQPEATDEAPEEPSSDPVEAPVDEPADSPVYTFRFKGDHTGDGPQHVTAWGQVFEKNDGLVQVSGKGYKRLLHNDHFEKVEE